LSATFGNCRVIEEIGHGSLSTVYLAVQEPLGREVTIKALKPSISTTSSFAVRLEREAQILSELGHPSVLTLHELVKSESQLYLVLEHVRGPDLAALLARRARVPAEVAAIVGASLARALEHVHERGFVHRDVKPGNILLSLRGEVKLIDFGIAQRVRRHPTPEPPEAESLAFGTPAYMSPEQILGDTADARSDLFSLGVVLYQMLAGARPFEVDDGTDQRASAQRIRRAPAVPLRSRAPDVPRPLERIVMRLLEKLPADRFASAGAVAAELEEIVATRVRGSPRGVVARFLRDAGFTKALAPAGDVTEAVEPPLRPIYLGFLAIFAIGAGLGAAIQSSDAVGRDAAHAGEAPLALLPHDRGELRVLATPWADVAVDGEYVDTTPFARAIPLAPGRHFVTLTHPDAPTEQRAVRVAAGESQLLDVTMRVRAIASGDAAAARGDASLGEGS
jgi:serine/threonine-protein kinase